MYITHAHTHVCLQAHANSPSHTRMRARTHACKNMHQCMHSRTQNPIRITCDSPCSPTEPAADPQAVATLRTVTAPRDVFRPCWQLADLGGRLRLREYRDASDLLSAPRLHPPPSSLSSPSELPRGTLTKAAVFPGRRGPEGCQQAPLHRRRQSGSRCGAAGVQVRTSMSRASAYMCLSRARSICAEAHMSLSPHVEPGQRRGAPLQQPRRRHRDSQPLLSRHVQLRQAPALHLFVWARIFVRAHVLAGGRARARARACVGLHV
jgi:hypothetical protein